MSHELYKDLALDGVLKHVHAPGNKAMNIIIIFPSNIKDQIDKHKCLVPPYILEEKVIWKELGLNSGFGALQSITLTCGPWLLGPQGVHCFIFRRWSPPRPPPAPKQVPPKEDEDQFLQVRYKLVNIRLS